MVVVQVEDGYCGRRHEPITDKRRSDEADCLRLSIPKSYDLLIFALESSYYHLRYITWSTTSFILKHRT